MSVKQFDNNNAFHKYEFLLLVWMSNLFAGSANGAGAPANVTGTLDIPIAGGPATLPNFGAVYPNNGIETDGAGNPLPFKIRFTGDYDTTDGVRGYPAAVLGSRSGGNETLGVQSGQAGTVQAGERNNAQGAGNPTPIYELNYAQGLTGYPALAGNLPDSFIVVETTDTGDQGERNVFSDTYWHDTDIVNLLPRDTNGNPITSLRNTINGISGQDTTIWNFNFWHRSPSFQGTGGTQVATGLEIEPGKFVDIWVKHERSNGGNVNFFYVGIVFNPEQANHAVDYNAYADWAMSNAFLTDVMNKPASQQIIADMNNPAIVAEPKVVRRPSADMWVDSLQIGVEMWGTGNGNPPFNHNTEAEVSFQQIGFVIDGTEYGIITDPINTGGGNGPAWTSQPPAVTGNTGDTFTLPNVRANYINAAGQNGGIGIINNFPGVEAGTFNYDFATDTITGTFGTASGNSGLRLFANGETDDTPWQVNIGSVGTAVWSSMVPSASAAAGVSVVLQNVIGTYVTTNGQTGLTVQVIDPSGNTVTSSNYNQASDTLTATVGTVSGDVTLRLLDGATTVADTTWTVSVAAPVITAEWSSPPPAGTGAAGSTYTLTNLLANHVTANGQNVTDITFGSFGNNVIASAEPYNRNSDSLEVTLGTNSGDALLRLWVGSDPVDDVLWRVNLTQAANAMYNSNIPDVVGSEGQVFAIENIGANYVDANGQTLTFDVEDSFPAVDAWTYDSINDTLFLTLGDISGTVNINMSGNGVIRDSQFVDVDILPSSQASWIAIPSPVIGEQGETFVLQNVLATYANLQGLVGVTVATADISGRDIVNFSYYDPETDDLTIQLGSETGNLNLIMFDNEDNVLDTELWAINVVEGDDTPEPSDITDPFIAGYEVYYRTPGSQWIRVPFQQGQSIEIDDVITGDYEVKVYAVSVGGTRSCVAEQAYTAKTFVFNNLLFNGNSNDVISWGASTVSIADDEDTIDVPIDAGSASLGVNETLFVYYADGDSVLRSTTNPLLVVDDNVTVVATYAGNTDISVIHGGSFTDGSNIYADSVDTEQLRIESVSKQYYQNAELRTPFGSLTNQRIFTHGQGWDGTQVPWDYVVPTSGSSANLDLFMELSYAYEFTLGTGAGFGNSGFYVARLEYRRRIPQDRTREPNVSTNPYGDWNNWSDLTIGSMYYNNYNPHCGGMFTSSERFSLATPGSQFQFRFPNESFGGVFTNGAIGSWFSSARIHRPSLRLITLMR